MNIVDIGRTRAKSTTALALASPSTTAFIVEHPSQYYDALDKAAAGNGCYANEWPYSRSSSYRGVDSSNGADEYRLQQVRLSFGSSRRALKNFNFSSNFAAATTKLKNDNAYYESFSFDDDAVCSSPEREPFINRHLHHNQLISSSTEIYSSQVAMQQRRLVVPDVKVRSHSTPSSPKLLVHSSESAKDCINNNNIAVPTIPIRKYSYDNRINRSNESFDHQQLGRNLSLNTVNRRRLPPTPPENRSKTETTLQTFRWSLPKMPPETERKKSAPPMLPESFSSTSSSKTSDDGIVIRTGTGRKLPLVPDFSHEIRNEAYHKQWQQDEFILNSRPCKTPPLTNSVKTSCYAYPPDLHTNRVSSPHSRKYCQRRTSEQSIDQYVGIPCTCSTPPPCTPIAEHLESKSSSDTEDHCLDSSLDKRGSIADSLLLDDFYEGEPDEKSYGLGRLLFSVLYFPIRKRLRISIIKAESLAGRLKPDLELNTFLKICLMPGKIQKQRSSRVVKGDRNAIFNEEYFFDNVDAEDIKTKTVLIRICHRMPKQFLKDVVVGELDLSLISLSTISAKREIKLCRELRPKVVKKLGRLQITTMLEKEPRRLTINILKVDNLPKYGITGPPDPCVRITVEQNGKAQTKQSRTIKGTCHASFKEAVMFLVSTRISDLENTSIDICVHDMARSSAGDDVIGRVVLGAHGKDRLLIEQWRNTFMNPGKEVKGTYTLKNDESAE